MANNVIPMQGNPQPVPQDWVWDGQRWVCDGQPPCQIPPWGPWAPPWFGPQAPPWFPGANGGVAFGSTPPQFPVRGHFWWNGMVLAMFDGVVWVNTTNGQIIGDGGGVTPSPVSGVVISATAPGNPAPGLQWWDGSQMRVWDGVQWNVIGPGSAVGPVPTTTISFAISQPGYTSGIGSGWTIVPFTATPQVDISLGWEATTKRFTPKKGGMYLFEAAGWEDTSGALAIVKNDPGTLPSLQNAITVAVVLTGTTGWMQITGLSVMNGTTDYVRLWALSGGSGTIYGNQSPPMLSAVLLP